MDKFKKSQEIVNMITIRNYYQDLLPTSLFYSTNEEDTKHREKCLGIINEIDNEIEVEIKYFLQSDSEQL